MSYNYNETICPKCSFASPNPDTCEACGALISVINQRNLRAYDEYQTPQTSAAAESQHAAVSGYPSEPSLTRRLLIILLLIFCAAAAWLAWNGKSPAYEGDGFVYTVFNSNFDEEVVNHAATPVLVDFYATWCGPCKQMAPALEEFASQNSSRVKVVKVDIDRDQELAQRYRVQVVPTLVLIKDGTEVDRSIGAKPSSQLHTMVNRHL